MPENTGLTAGAWIVEGRADVPELRTRTAEAQPRVRLTVLGPESGEVSRPETGGLIREEVVAARTDAGHPRVLLAPLAEKRFLLIVVTPNRLPPRKVAQWLLTPGAPFPRATDGTTARAGGGDVPATLRTGSSPSGFASTVHIPAGRAVARFRAAGTRTESALAAASSVLVVRYGGGPTVDLAVVDGAPVAARVQVEESVSGTTFLSRVDRAVDSGTPVLPPTRASLAVARETCPEPERFGSLTAVSVYPPDSVSHHDLLISLVGERLRIDYDTGLFEEDAIRAFAGRLVTVLEDLAADRPVHAVSALTADERITLPQWSTGYSEAVDDVCLHTLIERSAARDPSAVAVVCGDSELTYRQLDSAANRVAERLRAAGLTRGNLVALLSERSVDSVVAMVGVLKSGAAYAPIEPGHPAARIRRLLLDSGADTVFAHREPEIDLPVPLLLPDRTPDVHGRTDREEPSPDDLAYVIHTSGSTGAAKGIAVHHRAIVTSTAARSVSGVAPGRDLVLPPLCFDGAAGGLYWALTTGGTVVLPTEKEARDPLAMAKLLERETITHIHAVPSHYRVMLQVANAQALARLVMVAVGGEPLAPDLVAEHLRHCPDTPLFNDYGPTECAVWATTHRCGPADAGRTAVPVGRPVPNYRTHVLDDGMRPTPPGVPGEIYLGGPAVAHGYRNRPGPTAERFLPDPFEPAGRLYRTGDRGRWSEDGRLFLLGRVDRQVKVRGFRVEPGEVEATVRRYPEVADCAVLLRNEDTRELLVAFVVPKTKISEGDLRQRMAEALPAHMIPDHIAVLTALPRTPGGKIDALSLRTMSLSGHRVQEPTERRPPRGSARHSPDTNTTPP
ncbi:amino acid adenylation domain-containing protein [Streptomyces alkaliphilus]|uniref:Amino acid adenylation domain-containing protein n=1 Tax=Streptomyces alkaliphilus TaxID=1472722 RepID=A0A7W3XZV6_9ACTN|nr:amino acid adenylation domain-containing protein [Streptomyces alkaliphilus]MBB0242560.1 amino acid adenylation domain-containing protein [Streptomyces alkaliphilus]